MNMVAGPSETDAGDTEPTRVEPGTAPRSSTTGGVPAVGASIGRYVVLGVLGAGGMGEVVAAYDPQLDRRVALKLVRISGTLDVQLARSRLLREAQALAKLSHPNVVAVFDAGTHEDRVFIAMEHVEGGTLRTWLTEREDRGIGWRQTLQVLMQAGRGLAAAHLQGIVHRDFKPANVMVSDDGRVRVLDFGLARRFDAESTGDAGERGHDSADANAVLESLESEHGSLRMQLTQTGTVMGTPAYMAPEQFVGGPIDARTDQFSFCVVLYKALFDQRPFAGREFAELGRSVVRGELRDVPAGTGVPRVVQSVIRRGLAVGREDRYPTMDALLDDLERGLGRGRRRVLLAGGGVMAVAATVGLTSLASSEAVCQGAREHLSGVWDEAQRERLGTAFAGTELVYAEDARAETVQMLDAYAERWAQEHTEICEATQVRGEQSEALMDARIGCMDGRLRDMAALVSVFVDADADVVEHAVEAALQLPSPDSCATLDPTESGLASPPEPERAAEVERTREQLSSARALLLAGKTAEAEALAEEALERAQQTEHMPVIAEVFGLRGLIDARTSNIEAMKRDFVEALVAAVACGHTRVEARALIGLSSMHGHFLSEVELGLRYARHARSVIQRIGEPEDLRATLLLYEANVLMSAGRYDEAAASLHEVIELSERSAESSHLNLEALTNLSAVETARGNFDAVIELSQESLRRSKALFGSMHPLVAKGENNLAVAYMQLDRLEEATEHQRVALEILTTVHGEDHLDAIKMRHNLGVLHAKRGDHAAALAAYEQAYRSKLRVLGPDNPSVALSANNIGQALIDLGRPMEGIPRYEEALRIWNKAFGEDHVTMAYGQLGIAQAHLANGTLAEGVPYVRRVLALMEGKEIEPFERAGMTFVMAKVIAGGTGDIAEGRALAQRALASYRESQRPSEAEIEEIERWLEEHPGPDEIPPAGRAADGSR